MDVIGQIHQSLIDLRIDPPPLSAEVVILVDQSIPSFDTPLGPYVLLDFSILIS
jgi:hypothetical protein